MALSTISSDTGHPMEELVERSPLSRTPNFNDDVQALVGSSPESKRLDTFLTGLSQRSHSQSTNEATNPQVTVFSDCAYYAYYSLGLTLLFSPRAGYGLRGGMKRCDESEGQLSLTSIDIYNHLALLGSEPSSTARTTTQKQSSSIKKIHSPFESYPIRLSCPLLTEGTNPSNILLVEPETTGKDFVKALGEPDRKGGGTGSIGIWLEWTELGIMAELTSGGLQAWDNGANALWKILTFFQRGVSVGQDD